MCLLSDFLWEYGIELFVMELMFTLLCIMFTLLNKIFDRGVPGIVAGRHYDVWGRG